MATHDQVYDLFIKYLDNQCSHEEIKQLLEYFNIEENEDILRYLIQNELHQDGTAELSDLQVGAASLEVKNKITDLIREQQAPRSKHANWSTWIRFAAIVFISMMPILALIASWKRITDHLHPVKFDIVKTAKGQRKLIVLSDGSKVWLAPLGSLTYPEQFRDSLREIKLIGEAFFEVAKDKQHPFIIHTGKMDTKVVGTSFLIRAPENFAQADVTVVTGIVRVSVNGSDKISKKSVTLRPEQRAVLSTSLNTLVQVPYPDADVLLKIKDGVLIYHDTPVKQVIADLSNYYNVAITLDQKSSKCLCSGEFNTNKDLNITLEQLVSAVGGKVIRVGNAYQIKGGCNSE